MSQVAAQLMLKVNEQNSSGEELEIRTRDDSSFNKFIAKFNQ
jgi:hypothetical protein